MPRNFADRLLDKIDEMDGNPSVVGLDPRMENVPEYIKKDAIKSVCDKSHKTMEYLDLRDLFEASAEAIYVFNREIIDSTCDIVGIYKPQAAYYEKYKGPGFDALEKTMKYARSKGALVIVDAKRNDIKDTAQAYADAILGVVELADGSFHSSMDFDAMTINGYLGSDGVKPFIDVAKREGKGFFLLAKTSNPSSGELQDMSLHDRHGGRKVYEQMALKASQYGEELIGKRNYSSVGAVVGATYPEDARRIRRLAEKIIVLVPGYGSQGGRGIDTIPNFNPDGYGAIINSSSGISDAYLSKEYKTEPKNFAKASRRSAEDMKADIIGAMKAVGIYKEKVGG